MLNKDFFVRVAQDMGFVVSDVLFDKLDAYAQMLVDYNSRVNLTAITDPQGIVVKHFLDSLLLFSATNIPTNATIIDVGAGAGFPSLPCKLFRQDLQVTLLDSLNKRIAFLNALTDALKVTATAVHGRAEELGRVPLYRERFDVATARAVARLPELCEYCLPFVKVGGVFLAMKGSEATVEAREASSAIALLGGAVEKIADFTLPDDVASKRGIVVIRKISQTPIKYPRNAGQMKKLPL